MMNGKRRKEIMTQCPEEFKDTLKEWIDCLESDIGDVAITLTLDVNGVDELSKVEDAKNMAAEISDSLY